MLLTSSVAVEKSKDFPIINPLYITYFFFPSGSLFLICPGVGLFSCTALGLSGPTLMIWQLMFFCSGKFPQIHSLMISSVFLLFFFFFNFYYFDVELLELSANILIFSLLCFCLLRMCLFHLSGQIYFC